jgi:hypothetical protein
MPGVTEAAKIKSPKDTGRPHTSLMVEAAERRTLETLGVGEADSMSDVADRGRRATTICSSVSHGGCFVRGSKRDAGGEIARIRHVCGVLSGPGWIRTTDRRVMSPLL